MGLAQGRRWCSFCFPPDFFFLSQVVENCRQYSSLQVANVAPSQSAFSGVQFFRIIYTFRSSEFMRLHRIVTYQVFAFSLKQLLPRKQLRTMCCSRIESCVIVFGFQHFACFCKLCAPCFRVLFPSTFPGQFVCCLSFSFSVWGGAGVACEKPQLRYIPITSLLDSSAHCQGYSCICIYGPSGWASVMVFGGRLVCRHI